MAHFNLASVLVKAGRLSGAVNHFEQAVRLKANYVEAHYRLGDTLVLMGKFSAAKKQYDTVLRCCASTPIIRKRATSLTWYWS